MRIDRSLVSVLMGPYSELTFEQAVSLARVGFRVKRKGWVGWAVADSLEHDGFSWALFWEEREEDRPLVENSALITFDDMEARDWHGEPRPGDQVVDLSRCG